MFDQIILISSQLHSQSYIGIIYRNTYILLLDNCKVIFMFLLLKSFDQIQFIQNFKNNIWVSVTFCCSSGDDKLQRRYDKNKDGLKMSNLKTSCPVNGLKTR